MRGREVAFQAARGGKCPTDWHGRFDGAIANGSLEHWVQPEDVQAGRMNPIYCESFAIAYKTLDPSVSEARYVTTAIHVKREVKPEYLLSRWYRQPSGCVDFQVG